MSTVWLFALWLAIIGVSATAKHAYAADSLSAGVRYFMLPENVSQSDESGGSIVLRFEHVIDEFWQFVAECDYGLSATTSSLSGIRHWWSTSSGIRYNFDIGPLSPYGELLLSGYFSHSTNTTDVRLGLGVGLGLEWVILGPWSVALDGRLVILPEGMTNLPYGPMVTLRIAWRFQ